MKKISFCLIFGLLILAGCSRPVIEGTVEDYFGRPVEGVQVSIVNSAFTSVTDAEGRYQIDYLPGSFTLEFSKDGYSSGKLVLNIATKEKFPAAQVVMAKLPDETGIYLYEKDKLTPLKLNRIGIAGTFLQSISGISNLSKVFTTAPRPTFIIWGNKYPSDALKINRLTYLDKTKIKNVLGKTEKKINMWTATQKAEFKVVPFDANENLFIVEVGQDLTNGHYAISWGGLSANDPLTASVKNKLVYDFEYINLKAFSELRETAIYMAQSIKNEYAKSEALGAISAEITKAGAPKRANDVFSQALQTVQSIKDEQIKSWALRSIAVAFAKAGDHDKAIQMAQLIKDKNVKSGALRSIVLAFAKAGSHDEAIQVAQLIKDENVKSGALTGITVEIAKAGDHDKAIQTAQFIKNERSKSWALRSIAVAFARAGNHDKAIQMAQLIKDENAKSWALGGIAVEIAKAGDHDKAIQMAQLIKNEQIKSGVLGGIAAEIAKAGAPKRANDVFSQALQTVQSIKDEQTKSWALRRIAVAFAKAGDHDKANSVFSQAISMAQLIKDEQRKSWVLKDIGVEIAEVGDHDKAIQVAQLIKDENGKSKVLRSIAVEIAKAGDHDKAIQMAQLLKGEDDKVQLLMAIAQTLATQPLAYSVEQEKKIAQKIMEIYRASI